MTLTSKQKLFVIAELAMYGTPTEVAALFEGRFGARIGRDQVHTYDAGKARVRERMGAEHVAYFDEVRERWKEESVDIPIADKGWRLKKMMEMYEALPAAAAKRKLAILEQAAKETGGLYTNRTELTGKDGAPLPAPAPTVVVDLARLSRDELTVIEKLHERLASEPGERPQGQG